MNKEIIDLEKYLTASGKYPERKNHPELTKELLENAEKLLQKVNAFLLELEVKEVQVSSGFRPSDVNNKTPGAAKKSAHTTCEAIDIVDDKFQTLANKVKNNPDLLRKYDLWLEHPDHTKGWVHIDLKFRYDRPSRTFLP